MHRRRIADVSAMHRRRRQCIGDVDVKQIGPHIEPNCGCIGDAARSFDPIYSDPISQTPEVMNSS
eukprot:4304501-Pyramimonas_sp.AAC.1